MKSRLRGRTSDGADGSSSGTDSGISGSTLIVGAVGYLKSTNGDRDLVNGKGTITGVSMTCGKVCGPLFGVDGNGKVCGALIGVNGTLLIGVV